MVLPQVNGNPLSASEILAVNENEKEIAAALSWPQSSVQAAGATTGSDPLASFQRAILRLLIEWPQPAAVGPVAKPAPEAPAPNPPLPSKT